MLKFRITIARVYEADIEAPDYQAAEEIAQHLTLRDVIIVDSDVEIVELTPKLSELKSAS